GNATPAFTRIAANQTAIVIPPVVDGGGDSGGVVPAAPSLISNSPDDGSTVRSVATIMLIANQSVTWTHMTVTRPDGTTAPLRDAAGSSATWPFAATAAGLYVVHGSLGGGGQTVDVLSHFTIWVPPATGTHDVPPV